MFNMLKKSIPVKALFVKDNGYRFVGLYQPRYLSQEAWTDKGPSHVMEDVKLSVPSSLDFKFSPPGKVDPPPIYLLIKKNHIAKATIFKGEMERWNNGKSRRYRTVILNSIDREGNEDIEDNFTVTEEQLKALFDELCAKTCEVATKIHNMAAEAEHDRMMQEADITDEIEAKIQREDTWRTNSVQVLETMMQNTEAHVSKLDALQSDIHQMVLRLRQQADSEAKKAAAQQETQSYTATLGAPSTSGTLSTLGAPSTLGTPANPDTPVVNPEEDSIYVAPPVAASTLDEVVDEILYQTHQRGIALTRNTLCHYLYCAQYLYRKNEGVFLFDDDFEAWAHGPAIPSVFRRFKEYQDGYIQEEGKQSVDDTLVSTIKDVVDEYANYTSERIESACMVTGWVDARAGIKEGEACRNVIPKRAIL